MEGTTCFGFGDDRGRRGGQRGTWRQRTVLVLMEVTEARKTRGKGCLDRGVRSRVYSDVSPRLGLVYGPVRYLEIVPEDLWTKHREKRVTVTQRSRHMNESQSEETTRHGGTPVLDTNKTSGLYRGRYNTRKFLTDN